MQANPHKPMTDEYRSFQVQLRAKQESEYRRLRDRAEECYRKARAANDVHTALRMRDHGDYCSRQAALVYV